MSCLAFPNSRTTIRSTAPPRRWTSSNSGFAEARDQSRADSEFRRRPPTWTAPTARAEENLTDRGVLRRSKTYSRVRQAAINAPLSEV